MQKLILRQTSITNHVIQFSRYLREHGFGVGIHEESDLLHVLSKYVPRSFYEHKNLHKSILVKNRKQYLQFDSLYESYWEEVSTAEDSKNKEHHNLEKQKPANKQSDLAALKKWLYAGRIDEEKELSTYSNFSTISKKDFSAFKNEEQKELQEILRIISKRLANKASRRFVKTNRKKELDLKNTIKQSFKNGAEIKDFLFRKQKKRKVQLVLICDVSKSMELYSKFLIDFIYSFQQTVHKLHTFIFSTELVSISRILKDENYDVVLSKLSEFVTHWSGGTRIGESLEQFKNQFAEKLINKDSIVLILSDGWDTGDIETLESTMKYLHKRSSKIIWLNPLAGNPDYKPTTKGMQVCLPYIDVFSSAHDLESLKSIAKHLKKKKYKLQF